MLFGKPASSALMAGCFLSFLAASGQHTPGRRASHTAHRPSGIAWRVQGDWRQNARGPLLLSGDSLVPGALLVAEHPEAAHSITLLLPDGQRILYECFAEEDCTRGFRIPALIEEPTPFAAQMIEQMSRTLIQNRTNPVLKPTPSNDPVKPAATTVARHEEALVPLDSSERVSVTGLLSGLPNGRYTYNLLPLDHSLAPQFDVTLQKTGAACVFPVPAPGLYQVSIWDDQNTPRFELFLAAVPPAQKKTFASYAEARKTLTDWNKDFYGWPVDDLLAAYMQSLVTSGGGAKQTAK